MIVASFAQQYGIRLAQEYDTISYTEYRQLLIGIGGDTPLGTVVRIRAEKDPKKIKEFDTYEKRIYKEWQDKKSREQSKVDSKKRGEEVQQWLMSLFRR